MHMHHARSPHAHSFNHVAAQSLLPRNPVQEAPYNHALFVFHLNLIVVVVVTAFVLCAIPRFFYRFSHPDEWRNGHFLRSVPVSGAVALASPAHFSSSDDEDEKKPNRLSPLSPAYFSPTGLPEKQAYMQSDASLDGHLQTSVNLYDESDDRVLGFGLADGSDLARNFSTTSSRHLLSRNASTATTASTRIRKRREGLPAHLPALSARVPYATTVLRFTLRPGMDVGKALILVCYFSILLYGTFYRSNVFSNAVRTGYLAVSQIPVVVILGTKNNFVGMILGMGYERVRDTFVSRLTKVLTGL